MSKTITRSDLNKELYNLHYCCSKYRALYEAIKCDYDVTKSRFIKWLLNSDMDNYYAKYQKYTHRYKVVKDISLNFHKFIIGIAKKDFKNTNYLQDLICRIKFQEDLEALKFNYSEVSTRLNEVRMKCDNKCRDLSKKT